MDLLPLTVETAASPAADVVTPVAPAADVTLEETDGLQYGYVASPDPVSARAQI
jgi:hypothetical protein